MSKPPPGNLGQRKPSGNGKPQDNLLKVKETPQQRKAKQDDLRLTLGAGDRENNLLAFHEKVDDIYEEQEQLRLNHLDYLKEVVNMITE